MKKSVFSLLILTLMGFPTFAQDIVSLKSGETFKAKIIELGKNNVLFIKALESDTSFIPRAEVSKLSYRSGIIINLDGSDNQTFGTGMPKDSLFALGIKDAIVYYKGYKSAGTGTLIASFFIPYGLIPAVICSATRPAEINLGYPNQQLFENQSYRKGYSWKANKIKQKKVWTNFAIGSGITIGFYALLVAAVVSSL